MSDSKTIEVKVTQAHIDAAQRRMKDISHLLAVAEAVREITPLPGDLHTAKPMVFYMALLK